MYLLTARGRRASAAGHRGFAKMRAQHSRRRTMLRRNLLGIVVLALFSTITLTAQIKEMPKTPVTPINTPKAVDINSATANDLNAIDSTS